MKCPICGDIVKNGRCVFCGYQVTESDQEAVAKYEKQKAELTGGPPDTVRDSLFDLKLERRRKQKRPEREPPRQEQMERISPKHVQKPPDVRPKQPAVKPVRSERAREGPETKPARKCEPERRPKPKHAPPKRPHPAKRLLFKLIVFLWAALYITLILYKLAEDHRDRPSVPERMPPAAQFDISDITNMPGSVEASPEEGALNQYDR